MVFKRGIAIFGAIVLLFLFVFTTSFFTDDKGPTACVKNNAGVVQITIYTEREAAIELN